MRGVAVAVLAGLAAWGQSAETRPKFVAADIRASAKSVNANFARPSARGGRYEVKAATMLDLIRAAYGYDADKILGGPNWLELDRFDVVAKLPEGSTPESQQLMLQALLEDRFHLAAHKETKALPSYALTQGKKIQMKQASGSEDAGCKPQTTSAAPAPGQGGMIVLFNVGAGGAPSQIVIGPGGTIQYNCRNMTMEAFAAGLRNMFGTSLGPNPVRDETGLKGAWNFDLKYSMQMIGPMGQEGEERVSFASAVEKQLGLKLEERQVPTPVLVVDKVNRSPGENPPGTAEALPPIPAPTEFEVASVKPADPGARLGFRFQMQPGGRFTAEGIPLRFLIDRAFNAANGEQVVGVPAFAMSDRYDVIAKVPAGSAMAAAGPADMEAMAPLLLKLLEERFGLKYHMEERPVTAYSLVAVKPKMRQADPETRISCKFPAPPPGAPPGSRLLSCQNVTMAQLAERLQRMSPELVWPVTDATGIEGGWDVSLMFNMRPMMTGAPRPVEAAGGGASPVPTASEPTGGQTIFEAVEKQLGLKLEKGKRSEKVFVVDHLEQKPTEN